MRDRILGTSLDAIAAKDAATVIDVVNLRIAFIDTDALVLRTRVVGRFDINAFGGAGSGAQKTSNALFAAKLVDVQQMLTAITWLHRDWLFRILNCLLPPGNVRQSNSHALNDRAGGIDDFRNYRHKCFGSGIRFYSTRVVRGVITGAAITSSHPCRTAFHNLRTLSFVVCLRPEFYVTPFMRKLNP